jgi:glucan-binding YG repeat protein
MSSDEISAAPLEGENGAFEDPLTDPLALDDDYVQQVDTITVDNLDDEDDDDDDEVNNIEAIVSDTETNSIDNFIFVDIEKLKNKINKGKSEQQLQQQQQKKKSHSRSDINGNSKHSSDSEIPKKSSKIVIDKNQLDALESATSTVTTVATAATATAEIGEDCTDNGHSNNKAFESHSNGHSAKSGETNSSSSSTFVINASSEAETDEVTDTSSVLLEELRSDGSDSGLGLDTLRNISVIEKSLATLTPSKSSLKRRSVDALHEDLPKKAKSTKIDFGQVTVFYFPRCQGFSCVPTQGGSTLGMTAKHAYKK